MTHIHRAVGWLAGWLAPPDRNRLYAAERRLCQGLCARSGGHRFVFGIVDVTHERTGISYECWTPVSCARCWTLMS